MNLTEAQWTEEVNRCIEKGVMMKPWLETTTDEYFTMRRIGATFKLNRKDRYDIFGQLHTRVEKEVNKRKREQQIALMDSINFPGSQPDYEGMILSRQEAYYGE